MIKRSLLFLMVSFIVKDSIGQTDYFVEKNYPKGYFQWPVGAKIGLAANFGELRPNHFHMGLDCKTDQKENVPIYAAADGCIAKVKIEPFGFGRALYINHPNGLTTLYAHLNDFFPALEKYVTEQQYKQESWKVFFDIPEELFPVKKGDYIAKSGNTGGSQGPHLHFEIRDTRSDKVLNPLLFGFPIQDNIPPQLVRLALYDRNISTYEQSPQIIPLSKKNGDYVPSAGTIQVNTDKVSFAITAWDLYTGSTNQNGIFRAELFDNNRFICGFEMDSISYDETRYLNAHIDYKTKINGGSYLQHLSKLPGYTDGIYKTAPGLDGTIDLSDEDFHNISIKVTDANNNSSFVRFNIKGVAKTSLPDVATERLFSPESINIFENNNVSFYLPEYSIYDSFHFNYKENASAEGGMVYQLHNHNVPIQKYFQLKIKGNYYGNDTGQIIMKRFFNGKEDYKKATFENNWYKAAFRAFGNFQLMLDQTPPSLMPLDGFRDGAILTAKRRIAFSVTDDTEEIEEFTALLDGKWLRFSNDKAKNFLYYFDEHCPPGEHSLKILVKDLAGNTTEKIYRFKR